MARDSIVEKNSTPLAASNVPSNPFVVLSSSYANLEEGEFQHLDGKKLVSEAITVTPDKSIPSLSNYLWDGEPPLAPIGDFSPPSYADLACKKPTDSFYSYDENSIDQLSKKAGRKFKKEIQEEEANKIKTQGIQPTIEMSYGRNKRTKTPKGVITPSNSGK